MKNIIFISFFFFLFYSCNNPFPDYKSLGEGTYMKLISFEESKNEYRNVAYTKAEVIVFDGNEVIYHNFQENVIEKENPFNYFFQYLNEGDSAIFMVEKNEFIRLINPLYFSKIKEDYLKINIKVHHYLYSKKEDLHSVTIDKEMQEQIILQRYLSENQITSSPQKGVYILNYEKGKGKPIDVGSVVTINYKASFINYLQFDDTYQQHPFEFTYGTPDQVIEGLQIALKGMKKWEKSKIIITSRFAFGEDGSSTGIVPPFATVIYDLEIINVN